MTLLQLLNMCRMSVQLSEHSCKSLTDRMGQLLVLPMALWINHSLWKKNHSFLNLSLLVSNFKVMLLLGILPAWKGQLSALCACSALTSPPPQLCLLAFPPERCAGQGHWSLSHPRWSLPQPGDSQQPPGQHKSTARQVWGRLSLCTHQ